MNSILLCFKICAPRANLVTIQKISYSEIPPAKPRRVPSSDYYFFAAFASLRLGSGHALREIFRIFGCGFSPL